MVHEYTLLEKNPDPAHAQGFDNSDAIYLITPDRFVNGDPSNDNVEGMLEAADRSNKGGRHGGDIRASLTASTTSLTWVLRLSGLTRFLKTICRPIPTMVTPPRISTG